MSHDSHDEEGKLKELTQAFHKAWALALTRSFALFLALYALASALAEARGGATSQDLWWIDMSFLPGSFGLGLSVACAVILLLFALLPKMVNWRRFVTLGACGVLSVSAIQNAAIFYHEWGAGTVQPEIAVPFSLILAVVFGILGWAVWMIRATKVIMIDHIGVLIGLVVPLTLFPLSQVAFYGTADYRAKADAAVVFGARAFDDGPESPSLRDRVSTAVNLYHAGTVKQLIMCGGVEPDGIDETIEMRKAAERAGVPGSAILLDPMSMDANETVRETIAIFRREGIHRVLVVSQGCHLPRIKLAFMAAGWRVRTVPAREIASVWNTPATIASEIPAFWGYWVLAMVRAASGDEDLIAKES